MADNGSSSGSAASKRRELMRLLLEERGLKKEKTGTIARRSADEEVPAALNQEGLWFIDQLDPGKANNNVPGTVRLTGALDVKALERSLARIISRHESIRAFFKMSDSGNILLHFRPAGEFHLDTADLSQLPEDSQMAQVQQLAVASAMTVFDLSTGPLYAFQLLKIDEDDHVLLLNFHHIIADGWSMGIFRRELSAFYNAYCSNASAAVPELPIGFGDFARWQQAQMRAGAFNKSVEYWRGKLHNPPTADCLPADRPRHQNPSYAGGHCPVSVSASTTSAVREFAKKQGATPYAVLMTAFVSALHSLSGQTDVIIGSTFANRSARELENLIGFFVNTLPLRLKFEADTGVLALLRQVREALLDAAHHQAVPLTTLVKEIQPDRDLGKNAFFQVVFDFLTPDHNPAVFGYGMDSKVSEVMEMGDLRISPMDIEGGISRFDMSVFIWDQPGRFEGVFEYSRELFDPNTVQLVVDRFLACLDKLIARPDLTVTALSDGPWPSEQSERPEVKRPAREAMRGRLLKVRRKSVTESGPQGR